MEALENKMQVARRTYKYGNQTKLIFGGAAYFELLARLIDKARQTIHLQFYIFNEDATGTHIAQHLMQAAGRGVKVYLLVDGYASAGLSAGFIRRLRAAGVYFNQFEPVFRSRHFYVGRRLHHKVAVTDALHALVGGINIADRYNCINDELPWLDMALYVKGATAADLEAICCKLWNECSHSIKALPSSFPANHPCGTETGGLAAIRIRINDWVRGKKEIRMSYADLIANAQEDLVLACSYFLPGKNIRRLMRLAAERGVKVRVLVAGPSDVPIAKQAERFLYRWMLRNNIRIYEYKRSVLHAKLGIADGRRMTIGSYNVNGISAHASIELNLDVRNQPFVSAVRQQLDQLIANDCTEITQTLHRQTTNWLKIGWQRICYETIAALLYVFTFYFKRERRR